MNTNFKSAKQLCITAIFMALTMITTMFIQIPIPLGYANLGNSIIMIASFFFGPATGLTAGGIGSALADFLTGYPIWCLPTFLIKAVMGYAFYHICHSKKIGCRVLSIRTAIACIAVIAWMVAGYTIAGCFLYGNVAAGLSSTPGLALEGILHIILFYALAIPLEKTNAFKEMRFGHVTQSPEKNRCH